MNHDACIQEILRRLKQVEQYYTKEMAAEAPEKIVAFRKGVYASVLLAQLTVMDVAREHEEAALRGKTA